MSVNKRKPFDTRKMTYLAILTAIVFVLQFLAKIPVSFFELAIVLVPIVIGAAICGPFAGAWLGFVFGIAVFVSGTGGVNIFLQLNIVGTIVTVLLKGTLSGLAAGFVYKALERVNRYFAVLMAAIVSPIVNTGVFFLGSLIFFYDEMTAWAKGENTILYILTVIIGANFLIELAINIVLSPVILRIINIKKEPKK